MKRAILLVALLLLCAGYVFLQTPAPRRDLAALAPAGATLYLEARDFGSLLREWDSSKVKAAWLAGDNYAVFSRSNLFEKLRGVYQEYSEAAGFVPDLKNVIGLAGGQSALALYDIRDLEFLYISRIGESQFAQSALTAVRSRFEQRQAGGVTFFLRTDPASKRTVAFAMAGGYLFLATRDDLVGRALALLAGGTEPGLAAEPWYRDAAATQAPGELRMVLNMDSLLKSVYFRSYWLQRNASTLQPYWTGVADLVRSRQSFTETRVFLRRPDPAPAAPVSPEPAPVASLVALAPPEAGFYRACGITPAESAALVLDRLIATEPPRSRDWRYAPAPADIDAQAGSGAGLETRIDEPPLPADDGMANALAALKAAFEKAGVRGALQVESSGPDGPTFIRTHSVIALEAATDWNAAEVRTALSTAAGSLWTVSGMGAGFTTTNAGRHSVDRMEGAATLLAAVRGSVLLLANDEALLSAALDRVGTHPPVRPATYVAAFRHAAERGNYNRLMHALDFAQPDDRIGFGSGSRNTPAFFSGNLASLSQTFAFVSALTITEEPRAGGVVQRIEYDMR